MTLPELLHQVKLTDQARQRMIKLSRARQSVGGQGRAKVSTANANHANACEAYDRERARLTEMCAQVVMGDLEYH